MVPKRFFLLWSTAMLLPLALLVGCPGQPATPTATARPTEAPKTTISGQVTNSLTKTPLVGAQVTLQPAVSGVTIATDSSGKYTASIPVGTYTVTFAATMFVSAVEKIQLAAQPTVKDVALKPTSPVAVSGTVTGTAAPGKTVTLKASSVPLDGSTVQSYAWSQVSGAPATIKASADTATVTLADLASYKSRLIAALKPLDRFVVQTISPHALKDANTASFRITVTSSSGTYTGTVNVVAALPYNVNGGIKDVPINEPVLLNGKTQKAYAWTLSRPVGSKAALVDATSKNPSFTPDVAGKYVAVEKTAGVAIDVYGGTWLGVITGKDDKGLPVADAKCTACHNGKQAPDQFTPWKSSGHGDIFISNIENPAGHWAITCAKCHMVGYNTTADNGGFDEAFAKSGWKIPSHGDKGLWADFVTKYPDMARLANIQCENCHGPQNSIAHVNAEARVSVSSDVCAVCHGEPPSHGRFQQWEESGHGNLETAIAEGNSASCARCHTTQGFIAWLPQLKAGDSGNLKAPITWMTDTVQAITCVACHDPHAEGTTTTKPNNATVRLMGDTPLLPAGFKAENVGRGAVCMACHNSRNALHNDTALPKMDDRAPHVAAQTDVLMGQNAYFVEVGGKRAPHSLITDTCANCHMELSPAPAAVSRATSTNHAFEADPAMCSKCHSAGMTAAGVQTAFEKQMVDLQKAIEAAVLKEITAQTAAGNTVVLTNTLPATSTAGVPYVMIEVKDGKTVTAIELTESHGRQAAILTISGKKLEGDGIRLASDTTVKDATGKRIGALLDSAAGQLIAKAGWNYFLLHGDDSKGVHNPSFAMNVVAASLKALK